MSVQCIQSEAAAEAGADFTALLNSESPIRAKFSCLDQLLVHDPFPMGPARSVSPRLRTPHAYARLLSCQLECSPDMRGAAEHVTVRASDGAPGVHSAQS